ncbi:MAG: hypothetical protein L6Q26_08695, partial [Anaerolineales bacterium]|nr:hypothetical protein [Anaerolineales bacterium]
FEIAAVLAGNVFSMAVGILALVFYNDAEVKNYFARLNGPLPPEPATPPAPASLPAPETAPASEEPAAAPEESPALQGPPAKPKRAPRKVAKK